MSESYFVPLKKIAERFSLEAVNTPENWENINISRFDVNRSGLALAGYVEFFEPTRIQIIGRAEHYFLDQYGHEERIQKLEVFMRANPIAIVITHNIDACEEFRTVAARYNIPVFKTSEATSNFMAALVAYLNVELAERITRHGVLVEVYGEGIFMTGDSGVGKSETAIELVKRGHRLIADDAVEIKKVSATTLVGSAPELIRHYIELRGIGIVDVRRIFGMGAVKDTEKINLVINLEPWIQGKFYDRLGMDTEYTDIMGIKIPSITIPVKPGRNLAIIIEIAAMNNRQKKMGYNTAEEFNKKLMGQLGESNTR